MISTKPAEQFHVTALIESLSFVPNRNSCVGGRSHEHWGRSAHVGKSGELSCVKAVMGTPSVILKSVTVVVNQHETIAVISGSMDTLRPSECVIGRIIK